MFTWTDILGGLVLPAIATAAVLVVAWRLTRRRLSAGDSRSWAAQLAVGVGFASGYLALFGWPGFPPPDVVDWLFFLALPLAVVGLADSLWQLGGWVRIVSIAAAVPLVLWLAARPLLAAGDELAAETTRSLALFAAVGIVSLVALDALAARYSTARLGAILLAVAIPTAVVATLGGSLRYGQIAMLLAATQGGAWAAGLVLGGAARGRSTVLVFGTLLIGLLWCGNQYAELTTPDALVLVAVANMAWLTMLPEGIVQLALVLAAAAIAVARAWLESASETPYY